MSEKSELAQKSEQLLIQLIDKSTQAGDFIAEQAPLVIQELLTYNFVSSLVLFIVLLVISALSWYGTYRFFKWGLKEHSMGKSNIYIKDLEIAAMIALATPVIATLFLIDCTSWLKIWLAPRVYLLEYAANLVK